MGENSTGTDPLPCALYDSSYLPASIFESSDCSTIARLDCTSSEPLIKPVIDLIMMLHRAAAS
jgi:hypothetical protein